MSEKGKTAAASKEQPLMAASMTIRNYLAGQVIASYVSR